MDTVKGKEIGAVRLWPLFHEKLINLGIDPKQAAWFVKWAEGFAKSMKGPLASRSSADVLRYLEKLAKGSNIKEWQVKQAVQALQHLYQDQLDTAWARKWQWDKAEAHALALLRQQAEAAPAKSQTPRPQTKDPLNTPTPEGLQADDNLFDHSNAPDLKGLAEWYQVAGLP